jgi:hypothetical protein
MLYSAVLYTRRNKVKLFIPDYFEKNKSKYADLLKAGDKADAMVLLFQDYHSDVLNARSQGKSLDGLAMSGSFVKPYSFEFMAAVDVITELVASKNYLQDTLAISDRAYFAAIEVIARSINVTE